MKGITGMKKALVTIALLAAVLGMTACGGSSPAPQNAPKKNAPAPANEGPKPGQSYANEYRAETDAALSAWRAYAKDQSAAAYARAGTHFYNALKYRSMHTRNGHPADGLYKYTDLNLAYKDWKSTLGPKGWDNDAEYKKAKAEYDKVQQG